MLGLLRKLSEFLADFRRAFVCGKNRAVAAAFAAFAAVTFGLEIDRKQLRAEEPRKKKKKKLMMTKISS